MNDRKGNVINVGDQVFVLPDGGDSHGAGYVRRIDNHPSMGLSARVDDGPPGDFDITKDKATWTWSAWCTGDEIEKI